METAQPDPRPPVAVWQRSIAATLERVRPGLLPVVGADWTRAGDFPVTPGLLAIAAVGLAALVVGLDLLNLQTGYPEDAVNWLYVRVDHVYAEMPLVVLLVAVLGALSPAAGIVLTLAYGVIALTGMTDPYEASPLPVAVLGHAITVWTLWLLAVEAPFAGRLLALTLAARRSPKVLAVASALATGLLVWIWSQAVPVLLRPATLWTELEDTNLPAVLALQGGGLVYALAAAAAAGVVVRRRGAAGLLDSAWTTSRSTAILPMIPAPARRILAGAAMTAAFGGLVTAPLDAVALLVIFVGVGPLAARVGRLAPIGALRAVPGAVRWGIAMAVVFGLSWVVQELYLPGLLATDPVYKLLFGTSEFFSLIVYFGIGYFLLRLSVAIDRPAPRSSAVMVAASLMLGLLVLAVLAPVGVLADDCSGLSDCWPSGLLAALAGGALPALAAMASGLGDRLEDSLRSLDDEKELPSQVRLLGVVQGPTAANVGPPPPKE